MLPICILTSTSLLNYKGIRVFLIIEHFYTVKYLRLFTLISHSMEVTVSLPVNNSNYECSVALQYLICVDAMMPIATYI